MAVAIPSSSNIARVRSPVDPGVQVTAASQGAAVGRGLTQAGSAGFGIGERMQAGDELVQGERLRQRFNQEAQAELDRRDLEGDLSQDEKREDNYGSWLAAKKEGILGEFEGRNRARERLGVELDGLEGRYQYDAGRLSATRKREAVVSAADDTIDPFILEVATNPLRLDEGFAEIDRMVEAAAPALTPEQERKMLIHYQGKMADSSVRGALVAKDTVLATQLLADERISSALTAEENLVFAQQIVNEEDRSDANSRRAIKERQEEAATNLRLRNVRGELTEPELAGALERREINRQQFDQLLGTVVGGAAVDNSFMALSLQQGIYEGDIGSTEIFAAFSEGGITDGTAKELLTLVDQVQHRPGRLAEDEVRRERDWLDAQVGGMRGPLAVLDADDSRRVADALREFDKRIMEDPTADPRAIADRLARSPAYARPDLPLGPSVSLSLEEIDKAEDDVLGALHRGEISPAAAARELERIEEMRAAPMARGQSSVSAEARQRLQ